MYIKYNQYTKRSSWIFVYSFIDWKFTLKNPIYYCPHAIKLLRSWKVLHLSYFLLSLWQLPILIIQKGFVVNGSYLYQLLRNINGMRWRDGTGFTLLTLQEVDPHSYNTHGTLIHMVKPEHNQDVISGCSQYKWMDGGQISMRKKYIEMVSSRQLIIYQLAQTA